MFVLVALFTAVAALAAYSALSSLRTYLRLRHIPGPLSARLSYIPLVRQISSSNYVDFVDACHTQYGPVVVLAPDLVSVKKPAAIQHTNNVRSSWGRGTPYICFRTSPGVDNLFSLRDKRAHEKLRAKLAPGYTGRAVQGVEAMVDAHVDRLIRLLRDKYASGSVVEFSDLAQYFSLDVISSFAFGRSLGCLERDDDFQGYLATLGKLTPAMVAAVVLPFFHFVMNTPALKPLLPEGQFMAPIMELARSAVARRFSVKTQETESSKGNADVLGAWLTAGLSQAEAEVESVGQLAAGVDTTSTAIRSIVLFLFSSPGACRKLQCEVDEDVKTGLVTTVSSAQIEQLPYLKAVVREGLRLFTPVQLMTRSSTSEEVLCGVRIPAGINVEGCMKRAMRDTNVFGKDADVFRPERWLESDPDQLKVMEDAWKLIFGGPSRWECLGKGIALMQVHKVAFELTRNFEISIVDPAHPWTCMSTRVRGISDMFVTVRRRQ